MNYTTTKIIIYNFLVFLFFSSCGHSQSEDSLKFSNKQVEIDTCISYKLYECVNSYILEVDKNFISEAKPYYSLYFFEKNNVKYFTIWAFTEFPNYIEAINPQKEFTYYAFEIGNKDLIIIEYNDSIDRKLYLRCIDKNKVANKKRDQRTSNVIYDGSWYPQTFIYYAENKEIIISESDTLIADLLGADFLKFEKYCKNLP